MVSLLQTVKPRQRSSQGINTHPYKIQESQRKKLLKSAKSALSVIIRGSDKHGCGWETAPTANSHQRSAVGFHQQSGFGDPSYKT